MNYHVVDQEQEGEREQERGKDEETPYRSARGPRSTTCIIIVAEMCYCWHSSKYVVLNFQPSRSKLKETIEGMAPNAPDSLLAQVRSSCERLLAHEDASVRVVDAAITRFLESLDGAKFASLAVNDRFPLNFRSPQDEINFLSASAVR